MLYELSDEQVKNLLLLISNATIKGADAPLIMHLLEALKAPQPDHSTPRRKP